MKLTISMASFLRPKRTIRAIKSILAQNIGDWEAYIVGDGCPFIEEFMKTEECRKMIHHAATSNSKLYFENLPHQGDSGYIHNINKKRAKGEYFIFVDNDDVITPEHFQNYISGVNGYDFAFYDTWVEPLNARRVPKLQFGSIGHSEIICRTDFIRDINHQPGYNHDWIFIQNMIDRRANNAYISGRPTTYIVKSIAGNRENIDD